MATQELRRSQLVTTFGPGAMIDLPDESVIVAGLEHWHYDAARIPSIDEPRLVEKLKRTLERDTLTLRSPPQAADRPGSRDGAGTAEGGGGVGARASSRGS